MLRTTHVCHNFRKMVTIVKVVGHACWGDLLTRTESKADIWPTDPKLESRATPPGAHYLSTVDPLSRPLPKNAFHVRKVRHSLVLAGRPRPLGPFPPQSAALPKPNKPAGPGETLRRDVNRPSSPGIQKKYLVHRRSGLYWRCNNSAVPWRGFPR